MKNIRINNKSYYIPLNSKSYYIPLAKFKIDLTDPPKGVAMKKIFLVFSSMKNIVIDS
jgi:hypothetical protein